MPLSIRAVVMAGILAVAIGVILLMPASAQPQVPAVLTQHNDRARTGVNDAESSLTRAVVAQRSIRKLAWLGVRGQIYAQPLYLPTVRIETVTHKVVFVATMRNNVYAFDADHYSRLWARNFGCPVPYDLVKLNPLSFGGYNIHDAVGIQGTPVIDDAGQFMYFVTRIDRNGSGQSTDPNGPDCQPHSTVDLRFVLHKVDVASGADAAPPREVDAHYSRNAQLDPFVHLQRPGLLLINDSVYVAFGSNWDTKPWHGWVFRFALDNLDVQASFCVTPTGSGGGIWQAGSGLAANAAGDIIFMSGNGTTKPRADPPNLGTAFVQLTSDLTLRRYYVPRHHVWLNLADLDLGSAGAVVLPDGGMIGGGKPGELYMLGQPADPNSRLLELRAHVQVTPRPDFPFIPPASYHHIHGTPVVWNTAPDRARIFVWGERDHLKAYTYVHTPQSAEVIDRQVSHLKAGKGMPGGILSLTVDGRDADTAVLWASLPRDKDAFVDDVPGVLLAVDPMSLQQLWSNESDRYLFAKYCPPTVVDGQVFLATLSNGVYVYGKIPHSDVELR